MAPCSTDGVFSFGVGQLKGASEMGRIWVVAYGLAAVALFRPMELQAQIEWCSDSAEKIRSDHLYGGRCLHKPAVAWGLSLVRTLSPSSSEVTTRKVLTSILRQTYGPRPQAELNELRDSLVAIVLDDPAWGWGVRANVALDALFWAGRERGEGTIFPGVFETLVYIFETLVARTGDPKEPWEWFADNGKEPWGLTLPLRRIAQIEPKGRGGEYVLAVANASEEPEANAGRYLTAWCVAMWQLRDFESFHSKLPERVLDDDYWYLRGPCRTGVVPMEVLERANARRDSLRPEQPERHR